MLMESLTTWDQLTGPERMIARGKGFTAVQANEMYDQIWNLFVRFVMKANLRNANRLLCRMAEVFTDVSLQKRNLMKENMEILKGK